MSKNEEKQGLQAPTTQFSNEIGFQCVPPPSYEESQKMLATQHPSGVPHYAPQAYAPQFYAADAYGSQQSPYGLGFQPPPPSQVMSIPMGMQGAVSCSYAPRPTPPYQTTNIQQQQYYCYQSAIPSNSGQPQELVFAKGAKIRTTDTGAITVPPPPPGCAPTAAQLAAMQGQQVLVKKQKNSFF